MTNRPKGQHKKRKEPSISKATAKTKPQSSPGTTMVAVTEEQYEDIIRTLWNGTGIIRRNRPIATVLQVEANTGLRIGDVLSLRLNEIIRDGTRWRFRKREEKTKKMRVFTVPDPVYRMLDKYARANGIGQDELLFPMTVRNVQKKLDQVTDYLGYANIGTHSFRKRFATAAYVHSKYDVEVVRRLLQHSSAAITMRYIGISDAKIERTLQKVVNIVESYSISDDEQDYFPAPVSSVGTLAPIGLSKLSEDGISKLEACLLRDIKDAKLLREPERLALLMEVYLVLAEYVKNSPDGCTFRCIMADKADEIAALAKSLSESYGEEKSS